MKNKEYVKRLVEIAKSRDAGYFSEFAKMIPLTQEQYDIFWKMIREEEVKEKQKREEERWMEIGRLTNNYFLETYTKLEQEDTRDESEQFNDWVDRATTYINTWYSDGEDHDNCPVCGANPLHLKKLLEEKQKGETVECLILGEEKELTEEEFEFVKQLLGEPVEISNCCSYEIEEPTQDHTARCPDCKEGCGIIYVWGN